LLVRTTCLLFCSFQKPSQNQTGHLFMVKMFNLKYFTSY
jgi:hypothetical protein